MQHFLAGVKAFLARGVREGGEGAQSRAARAGFYQLGPVHGHVVLPVGTRTLIARNLWGAGLPRGATEASGSAGSSQEVHASLCQCASAVAVVPGGIRADAEQVPGTGGEPGRAEEEVPLQKQADEPG